AAPDRGPGVVRPGLPAGCRLTGPDRGRRPRWRPRRRRVLVTSYRATYQRTPRIPSKVRPAASPPLSAGSSPCRTVSRGRRPRTQRRGGWSGQGDRDRLPAGARGVVAAPELRAVVREVDELPGEAG